MLLPLYHCRPTFSSKPVLDPNPSLSPCTSSYFSKTCIHFHSLKPPKSLPHHSQLSADKEAVSKTAIQRIAEKLRSLGYLEESEETHQRPETGHGSAGEIFIPSSHVLPKHRVGHTIDASWSTPESPVPEPGSGIAIMRFHEMKGELEKQKVREAGEKKKRAVVPTLAELTIPEEELKRLRGIGIRLEKRLKIGKAGITEGIVNGIHERWRRSEVVKIKCEDLCRMNMKRTHEILERKTGGLVVWRSGSIIILYRGANYEYPYFLPDNNTGDGSHSSSISCPDSSEEEEDAGKQDKNSSGMVGTESSVESIPSRRLTRPSLIAGVGSPEKVRFQLPGEKQLEEEAHHLLDGLGPRFTDWWGYEPLPVDADLLPAIVPGYRKPFRLLPYGVKPKLTDSEMTILRRLGRPLPCHFALGRNRNLQGLAVSIVKLWEKCEIAKIAVKRGVQNTNSEMMAEEIKRLTGGTLLSRDREFIVFYRGKDFLPPAVSAAIEERRNYAIHMDKRSTKNSASVEVTLNRETRPAGPSDLQEVNDQKGVSTMEPRNLKSTGAALRSLDAKFSLALEKKAKAEKLLAELDKAAQLQTPEEDKEGISEEERYMLRKVGLRMKPFLLLGRRGVFDGTVENMHLHWKYRELVKVISKDRCVEDVHRAARTLEAESGGILVAVARVNKGHAIIIYRGKNYKRPGQLRPRTLLNKKEAMKRSLEAQRRESLKLHVLNLTKNIDQMKLRLAKDDTVTDSVQPTEYNIVTTGLETGDDVGSLKSSHHQVNAEAKEEADVDGISFHSTECMVSSCESEERATMSSATELKFVEVLDKGRSVADASSPHSIEHVVTSSDSEEIATDHGVTNVNFPENNMQLEASGSWGSAADNNEVKMTSFQSFGKRHDMPVNKSDKKGLSEVEVPSRVPLLSNKDRLILRKQALKMKKRPVLAVGRNNAVSGVAKAIKMHFQRNPLAIVSIKGRAKGTSAQEVVFMLEQATGAVLVSKEPTKVILYRGWGEGEEPGNAGKSLRSKGSREAVSPQLLDAIRLECGLPTTQEEDETHL